MAVVAHSGTVALMCNRYVSPAASDIERLWRVGGRNAPGLANSGSAGSATPDWRKTEVFPRALGAFIRRHSEEVTPAGGRELIVGQWGLIPWFAKTPKLTYSTNNARSEELAAKATFKHPWARGHLCRPLPVCGEVADLRREVQLHETSNDRSDSRRRRTWDQD